MQELHQANPPTAHGTVFLLPSAQAKKTSAFVFITRLLPTFTPRISPLSRGLLHSCSLQLILGNDTDIMISMLQEKEEGAQPHPRYSQSSKIREVVRESPKPKHLLKEQLIFLPSEVLAKASFREWI